MDPRTWWPYQSAEAREISASLTALGRWTVFSVTLAYLGWLIYAVVWRIYALAVERTIAALESLGVFAALTLALAFVYMSTVKTILLRSRYGKQRAYLADAFDLFDIGRHDRFETKKSETASKD